MSCWIIVKYIILPSITFPYAQSVVKTQVEKDLNEKYGDELTAQLSYVARVI